MNFEGKILPCRAKVKKCPYEQGRHGDSYEELYGKVMDYYSNVTPNESVTKRLDTGHPLTGFQDISKDLETTKAPMETMIATLGYALKTVNAGDMPSEYKRMKEKSLAAAYETYVMGVTPPGYLPKSIEREAYAKWISDGSPRRYAKVGDNTGEMYNEVTKDMAIYRDMYKNFESWERNSFSLSPSEKKDYQAGLTADFNQYSKALNTSKLISQLDLTDERAYNAINDNLGSMNQIELLSLYDDLNVSNREIAKNIRELGGFKFKPRSDISKEANENIKRWYDSNREIANRRVIENSGRILLSMRIARELRSRNVEFGDNLLATSEREA